MMRLQLLIVSLLLLGFTTFGDAITTTDQTSLLDLHNTQRAAAGSSNMQFMVWNQSLATAVGAKLKSQALLSPACLADFSFLAGSNIGFNSYINSGTTANVSAAVTAWMKSKVNYNYDGNTCNDGAAGTDYSSCASYLQIVASESNQLGCDYFNCTAAGGGKQSQLVCYYSPAINTAAVPFLRGNPCTQCSSGVFMCTAGKTAGLCDRNCDSKSSCVCKADCKNCGTKIVTTCTCQCPNGRAGVDCAGPCNDTSASCGSLGGNLSPALCTDARHSWMPWTCPVTCGNTCAPRKCPANFTYIDGASIGNATFTGSCYMMNFEPLSQSQAVTKCSSITSGKGHLAYFENEKELAALRALWADLIPGQTDVNLPTLMRVRRATAKNSLIQDDRDQFILNHNNLRRSVTAANNMAKMVWNADLESMAQEWANRCNWTHGQPSRTTLPFNPIGQNIYASSAATYSVQQAVQAWYNEVADYTYSTTTCAAGKVCGHYTQVVWAASYALGCGIAYCPTIIGLTFGGYFVVCNYGPAGNYVSVKPYTTGGAQCSACPASMPLCDNGLCATTLDTTTTSTIGTTTVTTTTPTTTTTTPTTTTTTPKTTTTATTTTTTTPTTTTTTPKTTTTATTTTTTAPTTTTPLPPTTINGNISAWIGGCRKIATSNDKMSSFVWSPTCTQGTGPGSGSKAFSVAVWEPREPSNTNRDAKTPNSGEWCIELFLASSDLEWNDVDCNAVRGFYICETEPGC